jgi:hypothetical protein
LKKTREKVPGIGSVPAFGSLTATFVYETLASTSRCPPGQSSVEGGGMSVRLPVIDPFLPEVNSPEALTGPDTVCFFGSLGKLPPLFWQAYTAVAFAVAVTVVVTVSPRPAILKLTIRLPLLSGPVALA